MAAVFQNIGGASAIPAHWAATPLPLPAAFSPAVQAAIQQDKLTGLLKLLMLRECSSFFQGICPHPKPSEYLAMSKSLCDKYPTFRDENSLNGEYWVRENSVFTIVIYTYFILDYSETLFVVTQDDLLLRSILIISALQLLIIRQKLYCHK